MKYLALDYGAKRIGVAVSNAEATIAFPRRTLDNGVSIMADIKKIIDEEAAETVVLGDTRTITGSANPITAAAEAFAARIVTDIGIPVIWAREAGSSVGASEFAPDDRHDDAAAAAFILQRYLDMKGGSVE